MMRAMVIISSLSRYWEYLELPDRVSEGTNIVLRYLSN